MQNAREYYTQCFANEKPTFVKVLKAVPPDRADYKPHDRSTSARDLVWLLAAELHDAQRRHRSGTQRGGRFSMNAAMPSRGSSECSRAQNIVW